MALEKFTRVNPRNINKERIYMVMDKADMLEAMKVMKERTFKVFMYLMSNQDGWSSNHARKAVSDNIGYDKSTVSKIFNELKELGYIVEIDNTEIIYSYSTIKGRPEPYKEPRVAGDSTWTEAGKGKKAVKASGQFDHYDSNEVDNLSTSSGQFDHTNTTDTTSTNITEDADASSAEENNVVVETTTAPVLSPASEDASASSGLSEQELRAFFRNQGNIKKRFIKDKADPWLKYGDGYTEDRTCIEEWNSVISHYEEYGRGSLQSTYQSLSLAYELWNKAKLSK